MLCYAMLCIFKSGNLACLQTVAPRLVAEDSANNYLPSQSSEGSGVTDSPASTPSAAEAELAQGPFLRVSVPASHVQPHTEPQPEAQDVNAQVQFESQRAEQEIDPQVQSDQQQETQDTVQVPAQAAPPPQSTQVHIISFINTCWKTGHVDDVTSGCGLTAVPVQLFSCDKCCE